MTASNSYATELPAKSSSNAPPRMTTTCNPAPASRTTLLQSFSGKSGGTAAGRDIKIKFSWFRTTHDDGRIRYELSGQVGNPAKPPLSPSPDGKWDPVRAWHESMQEGYEGEHTGCGHDLSWIKGFAQDCCETPCTDTSPSERVTYTDLQLTWDRGVATFSVGYVPETDPEVPSLRRDVSRSVGESDRELVKKLLQEQEENEIHAQRNEEVAERADERSETGGNKRRIKAGGPMSDTRASGRKVYVKHVQLRSEKQPLRSDLSWLDCAVPKRHGGVPGQPQSDAILSHLSMQWDRRERVFRYTAMYISSLETEPPSKGGHTAAK